MSKQEVICPYCNGVFYLNTFRLKEAKSVSCFYCRKRFEKEKV